MDMKIWYCIVENARERQYVIIESEGSFVWVLIWNLHVVQVSGKGCVMTPEGEEHRASILIIDTVFHYKTIWSNVYLRR